MDGRVSYDVLSDTSVIGGLRYDRVTLGLQDPQDMFGQLQLINAENMSSLRFTGDIDTTLWIPYFGMKLKAPTYRASFIVSPLSLARVQVPLVLVIQHPTPNLADPPSQESTKYNIDKPGWFFEFDGEYNSHLSNRLAMSAWMVANWLSVKGNGNMDHTLPGGTASVPSVDNQSGHASVTRYLLAVGVQLDLSF